MDNRSRWRHHLREGLFALGVGALLLGGLTLTSSFGLVVYALFEAFK